MKTLSDLVREPDIRLTFRSIKTAIVYAWFREGQPLYVGFSRVGLFRPFGYNHKVLTELEPTDELLVWCLQSWREAEALERKLIQELSPLYNRIFSKSLNGVPKYKQKKAGLPYVTRRFHRTKTGYVSTYYFLQLPAKGKRRQVSLGTDRERAQKKALHILNGAGILREKGIIDRDATAK